MGGLGSQDSSLYSSTDTIDSSSFFGNEFNIVAVSRVEDPADKVCKMFEYFSTVSWRRLHHLQGSRQGYEENMVKAAEFGQAFRIEVAFVRGN